MKFSLVLISVFASALADIAHPHIKRDHNSHAAAALHKKDVSPEQMGKRDEADQLVKRDSYSGTATYYEVQTGNAGACGQMLSDNQFVVALNSPQLQAYGGYQNGKPASCYQSITISAFGQQQQAVVMDECPTCGWGSLDLSPGLFATFTSLDAGVFPITWWFNSDSGGGGSQPSPTTSDYTPPPQPTTSVYTPPPSTTSTSSTPPPPPSTTSSSTSSSSTTSTSTSSSSTSTSSSDNPVQEAPTTSTPPNNLDNVNVAAVKMAAFIQAAAGLA